MILIVSFSCLYSFICMVVMPHVALSSFAIIPVWTSMILIASSWHSMINRSCRIHQGRSLMRCRLVLLLPMVACKQTPQKVHLQLSRHRPLFWLSFSLSCVCVELSKLASWMFHVYGLGSWSIHSHSIWSGRGQLKESPSLRPARQFHLISSLERTSWSWAKRSTLLKLSRLAFLVELVHCNPCAFGLKTLGHVVCLCVCVPFQEKLDQHASSNAKAKELLAYSKLFDHHHS